MTFCNTLFRFCAETAAPISPVGIEVRGCFAPNLERLRLLVLRESQALRTRKAIFGSQHHSVTEPRGCVVGGVTDYECPQVLDRTTGWVNRIRNRPR